MNTHIKKLLQKALEEINEATAEVPKDEDELAETVHAVRSISEASDRLRVDSQSGPSSLPGRGSFIVGAQQQAQQMAEKQEAITPDDFEDTEPEQPDEDFIEDEEEEPVSEDDFFEEEKKEMSQEQAQEEYDDLEIGPDPEAGEGGEIDMSELGEEGDTGELDEVESTKEVVEKEDDSEEDVSADEADEELDALWAEIAGEDE